jgi:Gas vesicle synthesis protein GvpL/GvpF
MPVLAYCITEARSELAIPVAGVGSMPVKAVIAGPLQCFVSHFESGSIEGKTTIRESALEFHRTVQELFRQVAVVPFRFPTILGDENEISAFLAEHSSEYEDALLRLRDAVQMEIRIEERAVASPPAASGTEYLRQRLTSHTNIAETALLFRHASEEWVREWRQREIPSGLRCYALLTREHLESFLTSMKEIPVSPGQTARVTGPWPATEFLKVNK